MRLSTKGQYGLKALVDLAINGGCGPQSLKCVAERQGLSEHYLEQLIGPLRKAGLVIGVRGAQGGYLLARKADEITVGDVLRVLEGPIAEYSCVHAGEAEAAECRTTCPVYSVWGTVREAVNKAIDGVTLGDLARQARERAESDYPMYHI